VLMCGNCAKRQIGVLGLHASSAISSRRSVRAKTDETDWQDLGHLVVAPERCSGDSVCWTLRLSAVRCDGRPSGRCCAPTAQASWLWDERVCGFGQQRPRTISAG